MKHGSMLKRAGITAMSTFVVLAVMVSAAGGLRATPSSASTLQAPAADGAVDYLPTAADVPGDFHEQATVDVGGLLEPGTALRRIFVSGDGTRTLAVEVRIGQSSVDAESILDARVNQLVQYQGGIAGVADVGERSYRVGIADADDRVGRILLFRVNALYAETSLTAPAEDPALLRSVSRFVEVRMRDGPDAVTYIPGFSAPTPQSLPGKEPPGAPVGGLFGGGGAVGNTAGGTGSNDTVLKFTLVGMDRPWIGTIGPRPPQGFNYLTVQVLIETAGPTPANILPEDFTAMALDGREWPPVVAREPALRAGQAVTGLPATGWLTFAIPTDQPATLLFWRLRSMQTLAQQGGGDQTLSIPLTVGASAMASIGSPAPPAGVPVQPPSALPPGSEPFSPVAPGAYPVPAAPSTSPGSGGGGSGGGGSNRGPRLQ